MLTHCISITWMVGPARAPLEMPGRLGKNTVPSPNMSARTSLSMRPEFSPLSLARAVWKHKWLSLSLALLVSGAAITFIYRLPSVYKAEALILVDPQKIPERFVVSTVNLDAQDLLATISQEIRSSTRLQKIINDFNLYAKERRTRSPEEVIEIMRNDIDISLEKGVGGSHPGAFRITYQGSSPTVVAQVVNRVTDLYIEENLRTRESRTEGTSDFIDTELLEAKKKLDEQELAVSRYKLQHSGELPEQENSLSAIFTKLQVDLQVNQDALNRAQQQKALLENEITAAQTAEENLKSRARQVRIGGSRREEVTLEGESKYQKQLDDLQAQVAALRARYSENHPDVKRLRDRIAVVQRLQQEEQATAENATARASKAQSPALSSPVEAGPDTLAMEQTHARERTAGLQAQINIVKRELQTRATERDQIVRDLTSYQRRLEQLPIREQEMAELKRDYDFSKTYYNSLLGKKMEAEMASNLEKRQKAETFRILDPARPPSKPFKPKRELLSAMSVVFGVILGIAAALGRELRAGVLLGEWELPAGVTVLSRVPHIVPSVEMADSPKEPKSGQREGTALLHRSAILSSATVLLLGTMAAVYFFVLHRI